MEIIGVGNQKGGVGKTTNAIHLAAALGERGRRCLVIDLDANLGLTHSFDVPVTTVGTYHMLMGEEGVGEVILTASDKQERASRPGEPIVLPKNVDLIPASRRIENFDEDYAASEDTRFTAAFDTLTGPLAEIEDRYDYVFLDTAPNTDTLTIAAYKTANWFILSSTGESLSVRAMARSLRDIAAANQKVNRDLEVLGVIMTQIDARKKLERAYVQRVKSELEGAGGFGLFENVIPARAVIGKASALCVSLFDYEPNAHEVKMVNDLRDLYRGLAREVEERIASARGGEGGGGDGDQMTAQDEPTERTANA